MHNSALLLLDEYPVPSFILHRHTLRFLAMNSAGLKEFGYTLEEMRELNLLQILPPYESLRLQRYMITGVFTPEETGEWQYLLKDGRIMDVEVRSQQVLHGTEPALLCVAFDIAARKQAEGTLRECESRYRSIVNSQRAAICRFTSGGRLIFANETFCNAFGVDPDKISSCSFDRLISRGDCDNMVSEYEYPHDETASEITYESIQTLPDGSVRWWEWTEIIIRDGSGIEMERQAIGLDITRRKTYRNSLDKKIREQKFILDSVPDMIFWLRRDGTYLDVYPEKSNNLILPKEELIGRNIREFLPPGNLDVALQAIENAFASGKVSDWQYSLELPSGEKYFESRINAISDTEAIAIVREITEIKLAEQALIISREKLSEAHSMARMGRWDYNHLTDELKWSDSIYPVFGVDPDNFELNYPNFLNLVHPSDRDKVNDAWQKSLQDQKSYQIDHRILTRTGSVKWVSEYCRTEFDRAGKPLYSVGIVQDITEKKNAEIELKKSNQLLQTIIDTIPVRLFWKDRNNRYIGCNHLFINDAGFTDTHEILGKSDDELVWKDLADQYLADDRTVMESGIPKLGYEEKRIAPGGEERWLLTSKIPFRDTSQNIIGVFGMYQDITERKYAEELIRENEQFLSGLIDLVNEALSVDKVRDLLGLVASRIPGILVSDNCYVTLWDEVNRRTIPITADNISVDYAGIPCREGERTLTESLAEIRKVIAIKDARNTPFLCPDIARQFPDHSLIGIPVLSGDKVLGAIIAGFEEPQDFSQTKLEQASLASKILSVLVSKIYYVDQLKEQEMMFRSFIEDAPIGIMAVNSKGQYIMANQTSAGLLNYSADELLQMSIHQVMHPDSSESGMFHFKQLLQGIPASTQLLLKKKDGTSFWSTLHGVKVHNDLFLGFHIDITESMESKEALAREKGLLSGLLNSIPDLVFYKGLDGKYLGANPEFIRYSGLTTSDFAGKTDFELFGSERAIQYNQLDREILETRQSSVTEEAGYYPDGTYAVWETLKAPFYNTEGKMIGLLGVSRNISEKKKFEYKLRESDELLKQLTANVPGLIYQFQYFPDGRTAFPYASAGIESVYEVTPEEVRNDASLVFTRIHPDDKPMVMDSIRESYREGTVWESEYRVLLPGRGLRWLHGLAAPTRQDDNSVIWHGHLQDITEKRLLEEKLRENEKYLKELFDSMEEVAWVMRYPDPELLNISQAAEKLIGYPVGDFYKDTDLFIKIVHPEDVHLLMNALARIVESRREEVQYRIVRSDGQIRWVIDKLWLHYDENDLPIRMEGILIDITRIKLLENDILFRSNLQQILMDMAGNFINLPVENIGEAINRTLEKVGRFVGADRAYLFDYDFESNTCSNTFEWCAEGISPEIDNLQDVPLDAIPHWVNTHLGKNTMLIPDVKELAEEDAVRQILEPQGVKSLITLPMHTGDDLTGFIGFDSVRHYKEYSRNEQELLMFLSEIFVNAQTRLGFERALVESERKFRQLAENVNDIFWLREVDSGEVLYANPAYCRFLGHDRLTVKLQCFIESTIPEDRKLLLAYLDDLTSKEPLEMELRLLSQTNEVHWFRLKIQPVTDFDGNVVRQVGLATDITRMKNAEQTLKDALEMEKKLGEMKSRFVSMASHEFRTPLASVIMAAETIENYRHKMDDEEIHRYVDRIKRNVEFLRDMISRVLNLSRIESGRMPFVPEKTEIGTYLSNWINDYRIKHDMKHFLEFDQPGEEIFLHIDRHLFSQVIDNLIINSRKYAPEHTTIRLSAGLNNRLAVISVADQGMGIPAKDQEFLFDPFFRASNATNISGTGLGLPFVKQIVERHGATIRFTSRENEGTTFFLEFPVENNSEVAR